MRRGPLLLREQSPLTGMHCAFSKSTQVVLLPFVQWHDLEQSLLFLWIACDALVPCVCQKTIDHPAHGPERSPSPPQRSGRFASDVMSIFIRIWDIPFTRSRTELLHYRMLPLEMRDQNLRSECKSIAARSGIRPVALFPRFLPKQPKV